MKKFYLLFIPLSLLYSCDLDKTPECNNEMIKQKALSLYIEATKPILAEEFTNANINLDDLKSYAWDNGLNSKDVIAEEREKMKKSVDTLLSTYFTEESIKFTNIRTEKIEEKIGKCHCIGVVESKLVDKMNLYYTAQKTEDQNSQYFVEINYKK